VAFSTKIYCKYIVQYVCKNFTTSQHLAKLQARKLILSRIYVCLGTVLLKDEELAIYVGVWPLLTVFTLILTSLR